MLDNGFVILPNSLDQPAAHLIAQIMGSPVALFLRLGLTGIFVQRLVSVGCGVDLPGLRLD